MLSELEENLDHSGTTPHKRIEDGNEINYNSVGNDSKMIQRYKMVNNSDNDS